MRSLFMFFAGIILGYCLVQGYACLQQNYLWVLNYS